MSDILLLTRSTSVVKSQRKIDLELLRLKQEAELAISRLNAALDAASTKTRVSVGLEKSYQLISPHAEIKRPDPVALSKPGQIKALPPTNRELAETARKLGMPEHLIAQRFPGATLDMTAKGFKPGPADRAVIEKVKATLSLAALGL